MLSALGHNVGHPGVTNEFLISMRSFTSILFNETAVLENYHIVLFLDLLKHPDLDILQNFSPEEVQQARKRTIEAILSTDRAQDTHLMETLEELKNKNDQVPVPSSVLDPAMRDACLMHAADHALALLNFPLYRKWAEKMLIEMHFQNTMDEALKLPRSYPGLCRLSEASLAGSQVSMIESHYLPFFSLLAWYFPGDLEMRVSVMKANCAFWQHIRDEEMKKTVALNVNPEQEEWRSAKLHIISSKIAESRDSMRVKAAEMMRAELTDVYYEPHLMQLGSMDTDDEEDTCSPDAHQEHRASDSNGGVDSPKSPNDTSLQSHKERTTNQSKEANRGPDGDSQSGNTPARKSALKKEDNDGQKAAASDRCSAGSVTSRKSSLRARFADESLVDDTSVEKGVFSGVEDYPDNGRARCASENLSPDPRTADGDSSRNKNLFSGDPETEKLEPESISGTSAAEKEPHSQSPESRTVNANGDAEDCVADTIVQGTDHRAPVVDSGARLPSMEGEHLSQTRQLSHASVLSEAANGLGEFVYDEATGLLFDQQGYAYDPLGNVTAYIDEAGNLQPYTSPAVYGLTEAMDTAGAEDGEAQNTYLAASTSDPLSSVRPTASVTNGRPSTDHTQTAGNNDEFGGDEGEHLR